MSRSNFWYRASICALITSAQFALVDLLDVDPIAAALMANAAELLAEPPQIEHVDVLAAKLSH